MYNTCLSVIKQLIGFWVKGNKPVQLEKHKINKINYELK